MSLGDAVVDVGADTSGFEAQLSKGVKRAADNAQSSISKIGKTSTSLGKKLSLGLTTPLIAIAGQAVKTQASFEQSMKLLGVNAGIGGKQLEDMGKLAQKMGADTIYSAGEAADAMLELSKGGFKAAQISGGGVQATMALAATEGLNLADAATIVGNAMNSFGLKAKNASQIADALAAGSVASSASVSSLAEGLGNVGPIARQSGLSLQQTVAALAELDQAGIKGAEGGTALRSFLTRLVPQGKKAKDAIHALGLEFQNSDGSFKTIGEISDQLHKKLGKLSQAERAERLQQIFGTYAKQAAAVFLSNGAKGYDKFTAAVNKSGTAQKLSDARMSGTAGAIEQMRGSVDTASLALGKALAPTVVKVAHGIQDLANWFTNLDSGTQTTIATIGALFAAVGPVLVVFGTLASSTSKIIDLGSKLSGSMTTTEGSMSGVAKASYAFGAAIRYAAGAGGLYLLSKSLGEADQDTKTFESTIGGAAAGFAVGGPIGGAIGALGGLTLALATHTKTASERWDEARASAFQFGKTLDSVTAKITKETDAQVLSALTKQTAAIPAAQALGLSQKTLVKYTEGNAKAQEKVNTAIQIGAKSGVMMTYANGGMARASDVLTQALGDQAVETANGTSKIDGITTAFKKQHDQALANAKTMSRYKDALAGLPKDVTTRLLDGETGNVRIHELETLIDKYHKTPKEVRTLVKLAGFDLTKNQMAELIDYNREYTGSNPHTRVTLLDSATPKIRAIIAGLAQIRDKHITITATTNANVAEAVTAGKKKKARGGPVLAGGAYWVGDNPDGSLNRTSELFVPKRSGTIVPANRLRTFAATAGTTTGSTTVDRSQKVEVTLVNPVAEKPSQSLPRIMSTVAFVLGG